MKKILVILFMTCAGWSARAQILHPVKWSYAAKMISKTEAVVFLKATIDDGWHIYSAYQQEGGPVPTAITFTPSAAYSLSGKLIEPNPQSKYEKSFKMPVSYFEDEVIFSQRLRLYQPVAGASP